LATTAPAIAATARRLQLGAVLREKRHHGQVHGGVVRQHVAEHAGAA
jgi:hypothetical protein